VMAIQNIVFSAIAILVVDWRLGLATLVVGGISLLMQFRFAAPLAKIGKDQLTANADGVKTASNIFSGAMAIRAYNMQPQALMTFDRDNSRLKMLQFKAGLIRMYQDLFRTVEGWLTMFVSFAFGGWLVATGRLEFSLLMIVFIMGSTLASSIGRLGEVWAGLQVPLEGAKRVFSIIENDEKHPETLRSKAMLGDESIKNSGYHLRMKDFSFRYHDAEIDTLSNINLDIGENKMVALVGESGSGKSTLMRAIIGMYERDDLGMTCGDLDFQNTSLRNWRQNFAYVDQSCKLFDMSIKENIAMGSLGAASDEDIIAASRRAAAHEFIEALENGYDAPCGEKGASLSGGQKQRIAIARALVKKAPILVFDEATSALDKDTERHIMDTIQSLRDDHTILITTHNLENAATADKIVVLDNGHIAEIGTHDELMEKGGVYCRLSMYSRFS